MSPDVEPSPENLVRSRSGGIYPIRDLQYAERNFDKRSANRTDIELADGSQKAAVQERDIRRKQEFSGWVLFGLAYQSVGVIYGDIGTSPLYVYSSTFSSNPSYHDLLGALSLIIWTLTLMVSVKYIFIVLRADDEGEGGTFALYSLLSRYANIIKRDPKEESMIKMERRLTSELRPSGRTLRSGMEHSRIAKTTLKIIGVLGVSLVMSDGVLTPAQSVLGAIQGLTVVKPDITSGTVIGVTCAILVLLFLIQPLGTSKIAHTFAPIVVVWLLFNLAFGIYNLVQHDHSVLKAFSPYFAGSYLVRNRTDGWKNLGGILLAFTGVEALFADLGAFSRRAVQLSWMCFTFPCLLLAYIGQAAYISDVPSAYANPFFLSAPPGMFYPSLIISILAAIVASQAMITSTFQLLSQIMKLSYFPQIKLIHTSTVFHGQVYIPFANWLLMVGTIVVTAVYSNTTRLGHAYGVCVILVTFITTCMVSIVALIVWELNPILVLLGFLVFGSLDGAYLSSALTKVPNGAWFTLLLSVILSSIFILWRFGKEQQWKAEAEDRFQPTHLVTKDDNGQLRLTSVFGGDTLTDIKGLGIFFDKVGDMTPLVFIQFLHKFTATPQVMVFFHLRPLSRPSVPPEERYTIKRTGIPNCYRMIIRHGYMDVVITKDLGMLIYEQLRNFTIHEDLSPNPRPMTNGMSTSDSITPPSSTTSSSTSAAATTEAQTLVAHRLDTLQAAFQAQVVYIVGKEQMRIRKGTSIWRRVTLAAYLWLRENTRGKMAAMHIPTDKLVEVGFIKEV